jgi:hypothetical protein
MEKELYQILDKPDNLAKNDIDQLKIQLKRVQNLAFLFNNVNNNQGKKLQEHLNAAEKVLNVATLSMEPERINASFLLRAYTSVAVQSALLGLLAIMLSAALLLIAPTAGIALCTLSTIETARALYGFYKEETKFETTKRDYDDMLKEALLLGSQ